MVDFNKKVLMLFKMFDFSGCFLGFVEKKKVIHHLGKFGEPYDRKLSRTVLGKVL
jgi:hypothetical protein